MPVAKPRTDAEYQQEADRLAREIRIMLDETKRIGEQSRHIAVQNQRMRESLKKRLLYANQNDLLRQELRHERELRERDLRELKLEIRLQIAEELRRLPLTE